MLVNFDLLLLLVLKNFDDGVVVVLLNFGIVGILMIGIGILLMRMVLLKVVGMVLRVNLLGNSVNVFSFMDSLVILVEVCGKVSLFGKKVNLLLVIFIFIVMGVCVGMVKLFGKSVYGVVFKLRVRGIGVGVINI